MVVFSFTNVWLAECTASISQVYALFVLSPAVLVEGERLKDGNQVKWTLGNCFNAYCSDRHCSPD